MMDLYSRYSTGFIVVLIFCVWQLTLANDRIPIRNVEVLTLYNGKMTNGRRTSPVPQLKCTGGSAGCYAFTPNVVQCYNRGWDGYDVQWECKTEMDNKYKFGRIQVSCEGYEYPDDPYILRGSCGLEYAIDLTGEGYESQRSSGHDSWNSYRQSGNTYNFHRGSKSVYGFGDLVMLVIVGAIIYMIYSTCTGNRDRDTSAPPPYSPQPNVRRDYPQGPDTPPPPYSPSSPEEPGFKREYTQGSAPPPPEEPGFQREYTQGAAGTPGAAGSSGTSSSGFWTGAATGGLLGYLFGGRSSGNSYYRQNPYGGGWGSPYNSNPYYRDTGRGWFGNWFGGGRSYGHHPSNHSFGSSSFGSSRSSSGSRTASGMGGTSRR